MKYRGPFNMPRMTGVGPLASSDVPDVVELELDGRAIRSIDTNNEDLKFESINSEFEGQHISADIYASLTDGSEVTASMSVDPYQGANISERGNRAHLFHLKVPKQMRGKGIGSTLMKVYKTYIKQAGFIRMSGRIGNGGTAKFMEKNGINPDVLHIVDVPGEVEQSVVIGTKEDARKAEGQPPAEAAEAMRGVPIDVGLQEVGR